MILKGILKNFDFVLCSNGVEAFEKFSTGEFGVVVTVIAMPEMNGIELVRNIRALDQSIPLIMSTWFSSHFSGWLIMSKKNVIHLILAWD